ncbi:Zn(II)2Cys6 transcription factor [Aspergillus undulatus]|uniref:Zn(II)2Cys6 transcription factor n=1 Tax=Aspergillus undulatus TaxID=1810928 RepID=UPI003CCD1801
MTKMPPESRTKTACKSCHSRRVKCDRTDQAPCSRCRDSRQECEPIVSRRGKHIRDKVRRSGFRHSVLSSALAATGEASAGAPEGTTQPVLSETQISFAGSGDNVGISDGSAIEPSRSPSGTIEAPGDQQVQPQDTHTAYNGHIPGVRALNPRAQSEPIERQTGQRAQDGRTIYYGDYFNLEYTQRELDENHEDYISRLSSSHHLHVDRLGSPTRKLVDAHAHKEHARLNGLGTFTTFHPKVSEQLFETFFNLIHPVAPIIDRGDFYAKVKAGHASPLLLQAMYLVSFSHCNASVVAAAGFENRYMATFRCYQRAKALYDADYEPDAIAVLQALYYLSFWWETPTQQKDMWYWTGIIVDLAQSLGMHREKTYARLDEPRRKLWKRLWWSIYSHDISTAVLLRRIPHVNDDYCTTILLAEQDFEDDPPIESNLDMSQTSTRECRLHTIYLADLCLRVSKCNRALNKAQPEPQVAFKELDSLTTWKMSLPKELRCPKGLFTLQNGFLASMLILRICTFQILLLRNYFQNPQVMAKGTSVYEASIEIVRILENVFDSELMTACPLRILPAIFAALSVLITNLRRISQSEINDLSTHRARFCMLALTKLVDYWPPLLLYYPMFARILEAKGCQVPPLPPLSTQAQQDCTSSGSTTTAKEAEATTSSNTPEPRSFWSCDPSCDAELFGVTSLFPFEAFLDEEFFNQDN